MQSAVAMAIEAAQAQGAARIHVLRMRVGALSGVVTESLEFAFELVCQGTIAAGARLEVENIPLACWCASCAAEFTGGDDFTVCPRCQTPSADLRRGRELEIASLEVE